jgi:large subunit ribosomal protein L2
MFKFFFSRYLKKYLVGLSCSGGRNFLGRICVYHKGGGNKQRFRIVDRYRRLEQAGTVLRIVRNRFKSALLGAVLYDNGLFSLVALSHGVMVSSRVFSGTSFVFTKDFDSPIGSSLVLKNFGLFSVISSLELFPFSGFKVARAPGCSAFVAAKTTSAVVVKLSSGWQIKLSPGCMAVAGIVSNPTLHFVRINKAGKNRALGVRPTVRGVVKNPCDHPHGGGEGKGSPPAAAVSPWGKLTKGTPTKNKKADRRKRRLFKSLV